jgi:hypothetical protein
MLKSNEIMYPNWMVLHDLFSSVLLHVIFLLITSYTYTLNIDTIISAR